MNVNHQMIPVMLVENHHYQMLYHSANDCWSSLCKEDKDTDTSDEADSVCKEKAAEWQTVNLNEKYNGMKK